MLTQKVLNQGGYVPLGTTGNVCMCVFASHNDWRLPLTIGQRRGKLNIL